MPRGDTIATPGRAHREWCIVIYFWWHNVHRRGARRSVAAQAALERARQESDEDDEDESLNMSAAELASKAMTVYNTPISTCRSAMHMATISGCLC